MTNCEKLYTYYNEHPQATNDEVMRDLEWSSTDVRRYKHRLKRRGFLDADVGGVTLLKPYKPEESSAEVLTFKQEAYRQVAEMCLARIEEPTTTVPQMIELMRELRLILKEIA